MKKIVFTLVALTGLLSATEYVNISNNVVIVSHNSNIVKVFKLGDIAYLSKLGDKNIVVLKQPANAVIDIETDSNQNVIGKEFANYLASNR